MIKSTTLRQFAPWLLTSICSGANFGNAASKTEMSHGAPANDPRTEALSVMKATAPHPSLTGRAKVFERLIGAWDVEYVDFSKDGKQTHRTGEFLVTWILDGRAIQDVWIVYPSGEHKEREVYTDLRYYDPKSQTWPSTFIDPEHATVARFTGVTEGDDRIVLNTHDFGGADTRWSVNDLSPDSFVWREEESRDGGHTWRLTAKHHMKRRNAISPSLTSSSPETKEFQQSPLDDVRRYVRL